MLIEHDVFYICFPEYVHFRFVWIVDLLVFSFVGILGLYS